MRKILFLIVSILSLIAATAPALARSHAPVARPSAAPVGALPAAAPSGDHPLLPFRHGVGGTARTIAVSGTLTYLGGSGHLQIYESGAAGFTLVGWLPLPNLAYALALHGNALYVASGLDGLQVVDVSDPTHPHIVGAYIPGDIGDSQGIEGMNQIRDVAVNGSRAYVVRWNSRVEVLDVADPEHPLLLTSLATAADFNVSYGVALGDGLLGVDRGGAISLYDLDELAGLQETATFTTPLGIRGLHFDQDTLYAFGFEHGFASYDVSDPSQPQALYAGEDVEHRLHSMAVDGTTAYLGADEDSIQVWDIADPAAPVLSATVPLSGSLSGLAFADHALQAIYGGPGEHHGLVLLDAAGASLTLRATLRFPGAVHQMEKVGDMIYVLDLYSGVYAFEAGANVLIPRGTYLFPRGQNENTYARGLAARDNRLYVVYDTVGLSGQATETLLALDSSDADQLTVLGAYHELLPMAALGWRTSRRSVHLLGDYAYVQNPIVKGIKIYDVSDPTSLAAPVGYLDGFDLFDLVSVGNRAYIAASNDGLAIIDITDPSAPTVLSTYDTFSTAVAVAVEGDVAYVSASFGIEIVDISDPSAPATIARYSTNDPLRDLATDLTIHQGYLNIAISHSAILNPTPTANGHSSYIQVVEIRDPAHPAVIAETPVWGGLEELLDDGENLYVAATNGGIVGFSNAFSAGLARELVPAVLFPLIQR